MNVAPTLLRRGLELASMAQRENKKQDLPIWGVMMLVCTAVIFFSVMFKIEYTFGRLLPTLLMIESPQDAIVFEPLSTEDPDSTLNKDPEQIQIKPQPITTSFRRTLQHLQYIGGFRARFRGLAIYFVTAFATNAIAGFLNALPLLSFLPRGVWNLVAIVLCAQLSLAWTHIVISEPSPKAWFRRIPSMKMWKKVAVPTAIHALAQQLAVFLPVYLGMALGMADNSHHIANMTPFQKTAFAFQGLGTFAFGLVLAFLIVIPASVTLTRVQASLLPDTDETIVPFDRSFGGKVIPELVGGSGVVSMLDAWKTFDWASRIRLIKVYVKLFALQTAVSVLFGLILVAEIFLMVGSDWSKLLPEDGDKQL